MGEGPLLLTPGRAHCQRGRGSQTRVQPGEVYRSVQIPLLPLEEAWMCLNRVVFFIMEQVKG